VTTDCIQQQSTNYIQLQTADVFSSNLQGFRNCLLIQILVDLFIICIFYKFCFIHSSNGTLPSNLTVTVDPTGNSTEPISCLSGDDCKIDECCVIGR